MKANKKVITMIVGVLMIGSLAVGCSNNTSSNTQQSATNTETKKVIEKVVYDRDSIKITYTNVYGDRITTNGFPTLEVELKIENNTDKAIYLASEDASIDGIMVDSFIDSTITPGKIANGILNLWSENEELKTAENVEFKLVLVDDETQMKFDEEVIKLDLIAD